MASNRSASDVSRADMTLPELAPLDHGGDFCAARAMFRGATEPFVDLSTGINPQPYALPQLSADRYTRLPERADLAALKEVAANAYGAPSPAHVVAGPGSQVLFWPRRRFCWRAAAPRSCAPTHSEHARAAELGGHKVVEV